MQRCSCYQAAGDSMSCKLVNSCKATEIALSTAACNTAHDEYTHRDLRSMPAKCTVIHAADDLG